MVKPFDKLNTPTAVVVVLMLFLVVDGLLFYRYKLTETTAASAPDPDAVLAAQHIEDEGTSEQEESAVEDTGHEGKQADGEKKSVLRGEEAETGLTPVQNLYPATTSAQPTDQPALVATESAAVETAPVPMSDYPEPVYDE